MALREARHSGAVWVDEAGPEEYGIDAIARRCHLTFRALVGYVEAGAISWWGRLAGTQSLDGLLFRKSDIYRVLLPVDEGEIALRIAARTRRVRKGHSLQTGQG